MSTLGPVVLELASRTWTELDAGERASFRLWLSEAQGADLHLLLHEARRRWRRPRLSSSTTLAAQRELAAPEAKEAT